MIFNSNVEEVKHVHQTFSELEIKNETMLFSADYDFARRNGDGLTHLFLDNLPEHLRQNKLVIDSRVHMLMPGWYPCIPGWHHDDVPRSRSDKQPNYESPEYYSEHYMMLINGNIAPTEFLVGEIDLEIPEHGKTIYETWNREINERLIQSDIIKAYMPGVQVHQANDSTIYHFDWQTFHRGVPAVKGGWRFFIRASHYSTDERFQRRTNKNQIRRQVQVYMSELEKGW